MGSDDHPGKMDEKLKSENMQKRAVFYEKFSSPQAARGIDPSNQNPADVQILDRFARFRRVHQCAQQSAGALEVSPGPPLACISTLL